MRLLCALVLSALLVSPLDAQEWPARPGATGAIAGELAQDAERWRKAIEAVGLNPE